MENAINIRQKVVFVALFSALLLAMTAMNCRASTDAPEEVVQVSTLPSYTFPYANPLYGTIAGVLKIKHVSVPGETTLQLHVNGFSAPMPVHAVLQDHEAPLVVLIPGISGKADSDFTRLWPSWYAAAGFNVLYFDSLFRPEMVSVIGRGVSGNVWSEAEAVRDIIDAYLKLDTMRPTKIGIVGQSYGGVIALILGQMSKDGHLPFNIDAIQAYSPPIDMQKTADLFDQWFNNYRWHYTLAELKSEVGEHKPVESVGCCAPLSDRIMKAAIIASFHEGLISVVLTNDSYYHLGQLPKGDIFNDEYQKKDAADTYGFTKYAYGMAFPYWRSRLGPGHIEELISATNLNEILEHQPACSETILARDDPFNLPVEMEYLSARAKDLPLTILPRGGHLGYVSEEWTRSKLLRIFDCAAKPTPAPEPTPEPVPSQNTR